MATIQQELGLTDEQFRKLRLFNRILISYNDFKQAHEIASLLVAGDLYRDYPRQNRHLVIALNMVDLAESQGMKIDVAALSAGLGVPVVPIQANRKRGS